MEDFKEYDNILAELSPKCEVKASKGLSNRIMASAENKKKCSKRIGIAVFSSLSAVAAVLVLILFVPKVSATELLGDAVKTFGTVRSMIMEFEIRTSANENFSHIELENDFVPHVMKVNYASDGKTWRVDKGGRVTCGNNKTQFMWIEGSGIGWKTENCPNSFLEYMSVLTEPQKILETELVLSQKQDGSEYKVERKGDVINLTVHANPQGDYTNPYMLNYTIPDSENVRRYTFDAKTRALKSLSIAILYEGKEIEIMRTRNISYNTSLDAAELMKTPAEVSFSEVKVGGGVTAATAEDAARTILSSFRYWDEAVLELCGTKEEMNVYKETYEGSELISVGQSFRSGTSSSVFVPYRLKFPSGKIKEFNIALTQYPDSTWGISGGL